MAKSISKKTQVSDSTAKSAPEVAEKEDKKEKDPVKTREYKPGDTIRCVSMTHGELIMHGNKSGLLYTWENYGDETYVEHQDLYALKTRNSSFIYDPLFIIDDDELLSQPRWSDVKDFYENMYANEDLSQILLMDNANFRALIKSAPKGLRKAIEVEMITRLEDGTFDSLQKIKIVDEICGTDLKCYID